jgi:hypothetical protein
MELAQLKAEMRARGRVRPKDAKRHSRRHPRRGSRARSGRSGRNQGGGRVIGSLPGVLYYRRQDAEKLSGIAVKSASCRPIRQLVSIPTIS